LIVTVDLNACKPCPFCGSHDLSTNGHGAYTIVVCCDCLAEGPHGHPSKAISRWNTRASAEIDMVTLSRSDLENSYNKLREALERGVEILTSPDMQQWRYVEGGDMHFDVGVWVNAARRALGGSNDPTT